MAKKPELGNDDECALIEFTDSASARAAQKLKIGETKIYELQQFSSNEKKRKQQSSSQQKEQQSQQPAKKSSAIRNSSGRDNLYINSSSCQSGSEEDTRTFRISKNSRIHGRNIFAPAPNSYQGMHKVTK